MQQGFTQKWELLYVVLLFFIPCCVLYSTISYSHFQFPLRLENDTFQKCNMHFKFQLLYDPCAGTFVQLLELIWMKTEKDNFHFHLQANFMLLQCKISYTKGNKGIKGNFLFFQPKTAQKKSSFKKFIYFLLTSNKIDDIDEMSSSSTREAKKRIKKGRFLFVIDNICCW